ncbi:MAG TPA: type II toxin-antitoxin system VapC family toxin [Acetobacteraceae bacterium]|nr:type II toxin-antitoxin system VapC family toxin [Acetobacteraceae bacterium]
MYLDASVLVPTIVEEQTSPTVIEFLIARTDTLMISELAAAEVASALSRLVCMERLARAEASDRLIDFDAWRTAEAENTDLESVDCRLANTYVRRFDLKLRAPDALHAAICRRLELRLVTLDRRLAAAARELGIAVAVPGA